MHRFRNTDGTTKVPSSRNLNYSTRYDDKDLISGKTERRKLDWLTAKLAEEIEQSSNDINKMERLQQRYLEDGLSAQADHALAYQMRYLRAYETLGILIDAFYLPYRPVSDEGKQNVN
jgi:hypothetical protein